jgi:hypothetical protein
MRPTLARLAVTALVPVLALATACGDDGDKRGAAPPASPSVSGPAPSSPPPSPVPRSGAGDGTASPSNPPTKTYNAFARCMRRYGVQVPDAGQNHTPPPEQNPAKAQRALKACAKLLASATPRPGA